jgi:hypothetical protein
MLSLLLSCLCAATLPGYAQANSEAPLPSKPDEILALLKRSNGLDFSGAKALAYSSQIRDFRRGWKANRVGRH